MASRLRRRRRNKLLLEYGNYDTIGNFNDMFFYVPTSVFAVVASDQFMSGDYIVGDGFEQWAREIGAGNFEVPEPGKFLPLALIAWPLIRRHRRQQA